MDGGNSSSAVQQMAAVSAHQVLPVSGTLGVAVGADERMNFVGGGVGEGHGGAAGIGGGDSSGKRKRGRPKKHPEVEVEVRREFVGVAEPSAPAQKRGRGRPKGSGKWQTLAASLSGTALESAGSDFIPHTLTVQTGENIVQRICSFAQSASESICILSASGSVSSVELLRSGSFSGVLRYEGRFEIITLSGSYAHTGMGDAHEKNFVLSVQLANSEGSLFGGAVGSSLIAGAPIQLIIATFKQKAREKAKTRKPNKAAATEPASSLQTTVNCQLPAAADANGLGTVSPAPAPLLDAVEKFINVPNASHGSPHPFDWSALQPSSSLSQHVMADFNPGVN